jgi:SAM-dependent methyltransferase
VVADIFGYHALQLGLGLPTTDALAANRMPHRWRAALAVSTDAAGNTTRTSAAHGDPAIALVANPAALPFPEASLDLVALPHTLEYCPDPPAALREIERVLVHEGHLVISGFNPASLWGLSGALPTDGNPVSPKHLRTLLQGTELELQTVRYGGHGPAPRNERTLAAQPGWAGRWSARLWPARGALWYAIAVKRSHGPKLVGPIWKPPAATASAQPNVAQRNEPAAKSIPLNPTPPIGSV